MTARLRTNFPTRDIGRQVDYEAMKRHAFSDHGILVVDVNDTRIDAFERQFLKNLGLKIFGPSVS